MTCNVDACRGVRRTPAREPNSTMMELEIFLRVHRMLTNFVELLEFRGPRCCAIDYKKIPLQGALDVLITALTSIMYRKPLATDSERPGMFQDICAPTVCYKTNDIPEDIFNKVETILKRLADSSEECVSTHVKDVLRTLEKLPSSVTSKRLRVLSHLLREARQKVQCCGNLLRAEPPTDDRAKELFDLVNNFVRECGLKRSPARPCMKVCRFCDSEINEVARRLGTFCCDEAEHLNFVWREWALRHSSTKRLELIPCTKAICDKKSKDGSRKGDASVKGSVGKLDSLASRRRSDKASRVDDRTDSMTERDRSAGGRRVRDGSDEEADRRHFRADRRTGREHRDGRRERESDLQDDSTFKKARTPDRAKRSGRRDREEDLTSSDQLREDRRLRGRSKKTAEDRQSSRAEDRKNLAGRLEERSLADKRARFGDKGDRDAEDRVTSSEAKRNVGGKRSGKRIRGEKILDDGEADYAGSTSTKRARRRKGARGKDGRGDGEGEGEDESSIPARLSKSKESRGRKKKRADDGDRGASSADEEGKPALRGSSKSTKGGGRRGDRDERQDALMWGLSGGGPTIEYQLSNEEFIEMGWTLLPVRRTVRKVPWYETRLAKPYLDWFRNRDEDGTLYYQNGRTPFLTYRKDGSGEIFYPNGQVAVKVRRPAAREYDMYTVYTPGGRDALGIERKPQIVAIFDTTGNGAVFDEDGAVRLSYNQIGGVYTDNPTGKVGVWTWNSETDCPIVQTIDKEKAPAIAIPAKAAARAKSPASARESSKMLNGKQKGSKAEEYKPVDAAESQEGPMSGAKEFEDSKDDPFRFKIICLKINDYLSLRIADRQNISLQFFAGSRSIKIGLGTVLNAKNEISHSLIDSINWQRDILKCKFEGKLPGTVRSDNSLFEFANEFRKIRKYAKQRKNMIEKYKLVLPPARPGRLYTCRPIQPLT